MHVHSDFESLYKEVPKRLLPEEYGGEAGPLQVMIGEFGVRLFWLYKTLFKKTRIFFKLKFSAYTSETYGLCCIFWDINTSGSKTAPVT
jgi:hypothetical protein